MDDLRKHDIGEEIYEILHGGYHYLCDRQLLSLFYKAEDLVRVLQRELLERSLK